MYKVHWLPNALRRLAEAWLQARDREAVTQAANRIDERLRRDPFGESESRSGNDRILHEAPLGVLLRVFPDKKLVVVLSVWLYEKRK